MASLPRVCGRPAMVRTGRLTATPRRKGARRTGAPISRCTPIPAEQVCHERLFYDSQRSLADRAMEPRFCELGVSGCAVDRADALGDPAAVFPAQTARCGSCLRETVDRVRPAGQC